MLTEYDAVIAGSGIIGVSIAYHLAGLGMNVALLDQSGPAAGATGAADGAVSVCSKKSVSMAKFSALGLDYFQELSKPGAVLDGVFHTRPSFYFSTNAAENAVLDSLPTKLAELSGSVRVKGNNRASKISGLGACVDRVVEVSGEGHMIGYQAVNRFLSADFTKIWPCEVVGFDESSKNVVISTSKGQLTATHFILATGTSAAQLAPELQIFPRAGQLIVTDRETRQDRLQGNLVSASYLLSKGAKDGQSKTPPIVIDPLSTGQYLIGSSRENHGHINRTDFETVRALLSRAAQCFTPLLNRRIIRVFSGIRAAVADGLPIIGPLRPGSKVFVAAGFEGDGISLSAIVGREVSNALTGKPLLADLAPFSPQRFMTDAA